MSRVHCDLDEMELEGETGRLIPSTKVTCSKCDHSAEVYGTSSASIRRGLAMLKEECPLDENNWYYTDEEGND